MRILMSFFVFAIVGTAHADPLGARDQAALDAANIAFSKAIVEKDFEAVVSVIPPRVLTHIAAANGVSEEALAEMLPPFMKAMSKDVEFPKVGMITEGVDVRRETDNGVEIYWGFVPTEFVMVLDGETYQISAQTLVLSEAGKWYFVRTSEAQQVEIVKAVYPFLAKVSFPESDVIIQE